MNGKRAKRIRLAAKVMLTGWLREQLPEEDRPTITHHNILSKLSKQTHFFIEGKMTLSPYSYKWAIKQLKKQYYKHGKLS